MKKHRPGCEQRKRGNHRSSTNNIEDKGGSCLDVIDPPCSLLAAHSSDKSVLCIRGYHTSSCCEKHQLLCKEQQPNNINHQKQMNFPSSVPTPSIDKLSKARPSWNKWSPSSLSKGTSTIPQTELEVKQISTKLFACVTTPRTWSGLDFLPSWLHAVLIVLHPQVVCTPPAVSDSCRLSLSIKYILHQYFSQLLETSLPAPGKARLMHVKASTLCCSLRFRDLALQALGLEF